MKTLVSEPVNCVWGINTADVTAMYRIIYFLQKCVIKTVFHFMWMNVGFVTFEN